MDLFETPIESTARTRKGQNVPFSECPGLVVIPGLSSSRGMYDAHDLPLAEQVSLLPMTFLPPRNLFQVSTALCGIPPESAKGVPKKTQRERGIRRIHELDGGAGAR